MTVGSGADGPPAPAARLDPAGDGLGEEVGRGLRTVVYRFGVDRVVKVPQPGTPRAWLVAECRHLRSVERAGAPCPRHATVVDGDGWTGLACERIPGTDLARLLAEEPSRAAEFGRLLVEVQRSLYDCPTSFALPDQSDRLRAKVVDAGRRHRLPVEAIGAWLRHDRPVGLCHGDLHPSNVILGPRGPVLVDWFDAGRGPLVAEVARTLLLLSSIASPAPTPLPPEVPAAGQPTGGSCPTDDEVWMTAVATLRRTYREAALADGAVDEAELDRWMTVQQVARLAEAIDVDRVDELRARLATW